MRRAANSVPSQRPSAAGIRGRLERARDRDRAELRVDVAAGEPAQLVGRARGGDLAALEHRRDVVAMRELLPRR